MVSSMGSSLAATASRARRETLIELDRNIAPAPTFSSQVIWSIPVVFILGGKAEERPIT